MEQISQSQKTVHMVGPSVALYLGLYEAQKLAGYHNNRRAFKNSVVSFIVDQVMMPPRKLLQQEISAELL